MKRNQMVKTIEQVLNNLDKIRTTNGLKAEAILSEVEKMGMLPPPRFLDMMKGKPMFSYDWEQENDRV